MPLTVTQLRIAILALNLLLTLAIGWETYDGVFVKPHVDTVPEMPEGLGKVFQNDGGSERDIVVTAKKWGPRILPRAAPPPPAAPEGSKTPVKPPEDSVGPNELPPGPLNDGWEIANIIYVEGIPSARQVTLQKKDPSAAAGVAAPKKSFPKISNTSRAVASKPGGRGANRAIAAGGAGAPSDKKTLHIMDEWDDKDANLHVWVTEIEPDRLIYEDANQQFKVFALTRKKTPYYAEGPDGRPALKNLEEPTDPNNPNPEKPPLHLVVGKYDRAKIFEARKSTNPTMKADSGGGAKPGTVGAASSGARPKSAAEALEDFKKLQTSEKYQKALKNLSKKDREALELLNPAGGKK